MKQRLVSFGCSLTYGDELADCTNNTCGEDSPSEYAWPNLLAKSLDMECVNLGYMGASNQMILRMLSRYVYDSECKMHYDWIKQPERYSTRMKQNDIVIVQWSSFDRIELFDSEIANNKWSMYRQLHPRNTGNKKFSSIYETIIAHETSSVVYERNIQYLNTAAAILKNAGLTYYILYGITSPKLYYGEEVNISLLSNDVISRQPLELDTFVHFAKRNNFKKGARLHPLEEAHEEWAKMIKQGIYDDS